MFNLGSAKKISGFSLIEVLVVIGITVLVFGGLFASFEYSLKLIAQSRAKMSALSLATDRLEYIRSLPYNDVGTVLGIPSGNIPQNRTVSLNGIEFSERVLIEFVDDPADGLGALDSNGILSDYKKVKIEYEWEIYNLPQTFSLISTVIPRSIETTAGGGTLRVNVFDASVAPLPGINVRLLNTSIAPNIDVTRQTDATGIAYFTGAPAAANYEIFVSAAGYSSDQTRQAEPGLENPNTLPVAVLESDISTMNFQVDRLSDLTIEVYNNEVIGEVVELFDNSLNVAASSSVLVDMGNLTLAHTGFVYELSGTALLRPVTPSPIVAWGVVEFDVARPLQTDARLRFYTSTNTADIISDTDLPGNAAGFVSRFIDISGLNRTTYPTLVVGVHLSTSNTSLTAEVGSITLGYIESRSMLTGHTLNLRGNKVIGTNDLAAPVYKYQQDHTTDVSGVINIDNIEWDSYTITPGGSLTVREACLSNPYALAPNNEVTLSVRTVPASANNLRVEVVDTTGQPVIGATVDLSGPSDYLSETSWCGQAYFGGLVSDVYDLEVSAPGVASTIVNDINIAGAVVQRIILVP
ncbi:MAG TPA: prepilin-type N-terminal cleavage/methylation domain-containing protein [Candidatus Paceibacterota bacterium]|nr:prepilin-type N-terminal cleavage/methylation domain-containing protein [Candidatus Paceibacterota bacterium]